MIKTILHFCMLAVAALAIFLPTAVSAQIVHYWDFEGGFSDTVGSGGGTAGAEVTTDVGHEGNTAAVFPGTLSGGGGFTSDGYVATDGVDVSGPFAFSYWFRIADDGGVNARGLFDFSSNGGDGPQSLYIGNSDTLAFRMDGVDGGGAALYAPAGGLEDDQWHFVVANYDPVTGIEVHVDGAGIDATNTGSFGDADGGWDAEQYLGAFNVNGTAPARGLDGSLDDVAIYSGNLSDNQIQRLYDGDLLPTEIPEPSTFVGLAIGIGLLALRRR